MPFVSQSALKLLEKFNRIDHEIYNIKSFKELLNTYYWADDIICNIRDYIPNNEYEYEYELAIDNLNIIKKCLKERFNFSKLFPSSYKTNLHSYIKYISDAPITEQSKVDITYEKFKREVGITPNYLDDICNEAYRNYYKKLYKPRACGWLVILLIL